MLRGPMKTIRYDCNMRTGHSCLRVSFITSLQSIIHFLSVIANLIIEYKVVYMGMPVMMV